MTEGRRLILVLGGARGGKSDFAEELAAELGRRVLYVATAEAGDAEMQRRIEAHRRARPAHWRTAEAPRGVAGALAAQTEASDVVLLDCLTLLVTNVLLAAGSDDPEADGCYEQVRDGLREELQGLHEWYVRADCHLIVVSNEVGMGLVPPYPLGRAYRDLLGWANRWLAVRADEVYLMVAGIPVEVKSLARWQAGSVLQRDVPGSAEASPPRPRSP